MAGGPGLAGNRGHRILATDNAKRFLLYFFFPILRVEQLRIDSTQHRGGYFYGEAEAEIVYTFH